MDWFSYSITNSEAKSGTVQLARPTDSDIRRVTSHSGSTSHTRSRVSHTEARHTVSGGNHARTSFCKFPLNSPMQMQCEKKCSLGFFFSSSHFPSVRITKVLCYAFFSSCFFCYSFM